MREGDFPPFTQYAYILFFCSLTQLLNVNVIIKCNSLYYLCVREAGFEPAHPEIVGLKSTALDHSAIRAKKYGVLLAGFEPATMGS